MKRENGNTCAYELDRETLDTACDQVTEMVQKLGSMKKVSDLTGISTPALFRVILKEGVTTKAVETIGDTYRKYDITKQPIWKPVLKQKQHVAIKDRIPDIGEKLATLSSLGLKYCGSFEELRRQTGLPSNYLVLAHKRKLQRFSLVKLRMLEKFAKDNNLPFPQ